MAKPKFIPMKTTAKQAQATCEIWQKRLRLQDWDVTVVLDETEDDGDLDCAHNEHSFADMESTITLYVNGDHRGKGGIITTLIHELLHLNFDVDLDDRDWRSRPFERGLDRTARALYAAYEGK